MRVARMLLGFIVICATVVSVLILVIEPPGIELGDLWHSKAPESLNLTQAVTQRYIHPNVWSHVLLPVLLTPAFVVFSVIAILALLLWLPLWRRQSNRGK